MASVETTLESWLIKARRATSKSNPNAPEIITGKVLKLNKTEISLKSKEIKLSKKNVRKLNNFLGRLLAGRPLSSVIHHTEFHNISLKINGRVLSPRAETEDSVEYAIKNIPEYSRVFDIGTGSGAIGLALAKARTDLHITLTDLTNKTLNTAKLNARKNKITTVNFIKSGLIKNIDRKYLEDAFFLANLPYVNPVWKDINHKKLKHEPHSALFAGSGGLQVINNLLDQLVDRDLLTKNNWVLLEHDPKQFKELQSYSKKLKLDVKKITDFVTLVKIS